MYISLFSDDPCFASVVPYFFNPIHVNVFRLNQLIEEMRTKIDCSNLIIGVPLLSESDWEYLSRIPRYQIPSYIMTRRNFTHEEMLRARSLGFNEIILGPISRLRGTFFNLDSLLSILQATTDEENCVYIGLNTYFNEEQNWIKNYDNKVNLSDREAAVLKLFLQNEGQILTKSIIAHEIWQGHIVKAGIPKLISRLRDKLGPAKQLIAGRKQGGYIYENH